MAMRNRLVSMFGLKDLERVGGAANINVGQRIGILTLQSNSGTEIVSFFLDVNDDKVTVHTTTMVLYIICWAKSTCLLLRQFISLLSRVH